MINHLLGRSDNSAYDFLVYDESDPSGSKRMLRKSLRAHFEESDISTEHLITVEYFLSLPRPSDGGKVDSDEWIGSVAGLKDTTGLGMFASGSYNGSLSLVYGNQTCVCSVSAHEGPIKAVAYGGGDIVVSGGQDKTLKTWRVTSSNELIPVGDALFDEKSFFLDFSFFVSIDIVRWALVCHRIVLMKVQSNVAQYEMISPLVLQW